MTAGTPAARVREQEGRQCHVRGEVAGPHAELAVGREVTLAVDLTAAYFFDPDTGEAVPARREPPTQTLQTAHKESVGV
jgi:hypothetical protein